MQGRKELLEEILRYDNPQQLQKLREDLRTYGWDSHEDLVTLTKENVISVLQRYLRSELTAKEVEDWAEAIDMREDVKFGLGDEEDTQSIVMELAGPVVPLTPEYARRLIEELRVPSVSAANRPGT